MKRRKFIQNAFPATAMIPGLMNGFPMRVLGAENSFLQTAMMPGIDTDKVLVIVQLSGGNDGLNNVIPISTYGDYVNARKNIAIPENKILRLDGIDRTGLHPALAPFQQLYNDGKMNIIQAVGYPSPNFSHFRATDIWMSASDSNQMVNSGWIGRYLDQEFPGFPNGYPTTEMPDPLALQVGAITSLTCQGPSVSMGMSLTDPASFYKLVDNQVDDTPNTPMGNELKFVRQIARQTNKYGDRIRQAAAAVPTQGTYPNNPLAAQLKIVARLIKGGLKTRVYMVSYGGFDTHANQVVASDTTTGNHANLLNNVSSSIKAFMDDLKGLGVDDRVLGMTFSEFGRRIKSNASIGTDHGSSAPLYLFGKHVMGGITGNNPFIPANSTVGDNIPYQYDFRSIYASVLQQWFCVPDTTLQQVMLKNFQSLPLINNPKCGTNNRPPNFSDEKLLVFNYPNPFSTYTKITYRTKGGHTLLQLIDTSGRLLKVILERTYSSEGQHTIEFNGDFLPAGIYYIRLQNGPIQQVRAVMKAS
ncbi:MAG: DUF1501 domain-containing protein [Chitinophagaceae bacterium]